MAKRKTRKSTGGRQPRGRATQAATATTIRGPRRQAIVVLGMHRSGTSALTRVLSLLGADLPRNLLDSLIGNEKGHWESSDVLMIHEEYLSALASKWDDWREIEPASFQSSLSETYKQRLLGVLQRDFQNSSLFLVKDPRVCRFVPLWLDVLDRFDAAPKIVIPVRNPLETAASLKARDGFPPAKSYLLYLRHLLDAEKATRGLPRVFVTYNDLLDDWRGLAGRVAHTTGLAWPRLSDRSALEIEHFLSTALRHHASAQDQLNARAEIVDWVKETHDALSRLADGAKGDSQLIRLDRVREAFNKASGAFGQALMAEEDSLATAKERETAQISTELAATRSEVQERIRDIEALRADIDSRAAEIAALQDVNKRAYEDIEAARSELGAARVEIDALVAGQRSLEAQWHSERDSYQGLAQNLNTELQSLGLRLAEQDMFAAERLALLDDAQQKIVVLTQEVETVRQAAHSELDAARLKVDSLGASQRDIEAQWQSEREVYALELEAAREWLREAQTMAQSLAGELDAAQTALAAEKSAHEVTQSELYRAAAIETRMTAATAALATERERRAEDALQWQERIAASQAAADTLRQERDKLASELGLARDLAAIERERHEADSRRLHDEAAAQAARADETARDLAALRVQAEAMRATVTEQAARLAAPPSLRARLARPFVSPLAGLKRRFARWKRPDFRAREWEAKAIRASRLFSPLWYLQRYPDVAAAGQDPLAHYLAHGAAEDRDPHPLFDARWYRDSYPQARAARMSPLAHYASVGVSEGLDPHPLFDTDFYLRNHPDVAASGLNPLWHYMTYGGFEGRDPHPMFDSSWYLQQNPDVAKVRDNPLLHYLTHGWKEGREPTALFDSAFYVRNNPQVCETQNPLLHYLLQGPTGRNNNATATSSL